MEVEEEPFLFVSRDRNALVFFAVLGTGEIAAVFILLSVEVLGERLSVISSELTAGGNARSIIYLHN